MLRPNIQNVSILMDGYHSAVGHAELHVLQCNLDSCVAFVVTNGIAGDPVSHDTLILNVDVFHFAFLENGQDGGFCPRGLQSPRLAIYWLIYILCLVMQLDISS